MNEQTLGQKRVKAEFNPAKNDLVDQIKNKSAELIDLAAKCGLITSELSSIISQMEDKDNASDELKRITSIAGKELKSIKYCYEGILVEAESFCMWAVKASFIE